MTYVEGETVLVFDAQAWRAVGHDTGDNSQFWRAATIIYLYRNEHEEQLANVQFSDRVSHGHFVYALKSCNPYRNETE